MIESVPVSQDKNNPVFDEQTLAKLLEAAYILQEHGHELRKAEAELGRKRDFVAAQKPAVPKSPPRETRLPQPMPPAFIASPEFENQDYSSTLAQIVATQHEIEVQQLKGDGALSLIASQLIDICGAAGAAVGLVAGNNVRYRAIAGIRALQIGSEVPVEKALCAPCLRTGEVFSCADATPQSRNDGGGECRRRGIGSLIVVPVLHETEVIGALELYYSDPRAFTEQDVNTCQLMAGLVAEVLPHDEHTSLSPVAVERLSPGSEEMTKLQRPAESISIPANANSAVVCEKCGHKLVEEEQFCGECGAPRAKTPKPVSPVSKAVPYWLQVRKKGSYTSATRREEESPALATPPAAPLPDSEKTPAELIAEAGEKPLEAATDLQAEGNEISEAEVEPIAELDSAATPDWSSALSARQFLEQLAAGNRKSAVVQFWNARRGDIYLAIAVVLVIFAIRWGIQSNRPVSAPVPTTTAANHKPPAEPELSPFDRMLVSLGLAEAPEPPQDKGNPTIQVWVDVHTGLYYCPGADSYGKTPTGKYATQRDAQLDHFQPAYRKPCN